MAGAKRAFITNQGGCGGKNSLTKQGSIQNAIQETRRMLRFFEGHAPLRERQLSWGEALNKRLDFLQPPQLDEKAQRLTKARHFFYSLPLMINPNSTQTCFSKYLQMEPSALFLLSY